MKFVLFLLYTISFQGILSEKVEVKNKCKCSNILTMEECNIHCEWDLDTKKCKDSSLPLIRTSYCSFLQDKCNKTIGCANYNGICVPFAGCTAIKQNTNYECQKYSELCITDGLKCIEKGVCADYKTRLSCRNNYINNQWSGFCYWDKMECRNAQSCHELSHSLKNDAECRQQFSWCTFKMGGGCENSGEQCKDQKFQQQCVTNKKGNVKCYWDGQECNDYSCKYIKQDCVKKGCSIDEDFLCMDRLECNEYKIERSCTYNKSNIQCMWEDNVCRIKLCENASIQRQTNQQCQQIDIMCITKFGGGCKNNGECEEANTKAGCQQNIRGDSCYWNGYNCVIKQCQWAPVIFQRKDECQNFQSTCVYNGQICIEEGCYAQSENLSCSASKQCKWLKKCDIKTCETAGRNIIYISHDECQNYLPNCTLNDSGIGCMLIKYSCNQYVRQIQCYLSIQSKCTWYDNQCLDSKCEYLNYKTHYECNNYLKNCTSDGQKCIELKLKCSQYTEIHSCNINQDNQHCVWQNNTCQDVTCDSIPKSYYYNTHQDCNTYLQKCTILERITGCIKMPSDCSLLNQEQCYGKKCIYINGLCREKECKDYKGDITQANCENFIEGKKCMRGPSLIPNSCVDQVQECLEIKNEYQCEDAKDNHNNKCRWEFSACIKWTEILLRKINGNCPDGSISFDDNFCSKQKQCNDKDIATVEYTDQICENYLISCQKNTINTCQEKLVNISSGCSFYLSKINCISQSNCYWSFDNTCKTIKSNCDELLIKEDCQDNREESGTYCSWDDDNTRCQNICETLTPKNLSCSILDPKCILKGSNNEKCIKKLENCSDYKVSEQECEDDDRCTYTFGFCIEKQCSDITDSLTHDECNSYKSECTIAYPGGCTNLLPKCSDYKSEIQCHINNLSKDCYWFEYKGCVEQECKEITYDSELGVNQCLTFFDNLICNINELGNGCENLKDSCTKYNNEKQCQKQLDGYECIWQSDTCVQALCENIELNIYTHEDCYNQYEKVKCTVNQDNDRCIDLFSDCKLYITKEQCLITLNKEDCVWDQLYSQCKFKSCKDDIPNNQKCSDYLSSCMEPQYLCRNVICEDYEYDNDEECKLQDNKCTSNGRFCIQRGTCEQNQYKQACNIDINNKLCSWNFVKQQCSYVQCQDAPSSLIHTQECEKYFPNQNCITKFGGGCLIVTGCFDYTIQGQCDESKLFDCIWQNNTCRSKLCSDYKNSYILECQSKPQNCTTDGTTCIEMKNCAQLSKQSCFIGIDGICLYLNDRCQLYQNCQSIYFTSHQECYDALQNQCTSDGIQCIPITYCDQYSNQKSCVKGIDGDCAWENSKCIKFTSCKNYLYKTHEECNSINQSCTSDTINKCIELLECSKYVENNCKIDKNGIVKKDGLIIKLNTCIWKNQQCINITCSDLYGTDHLSCYRQMSTCTSDSVKCIIMEKTCSNYSTNICDTAYSQEGKCANLNSICSIIDCSIKTVESQCNVLKHCQFINGSCQSYSKCQEYKTEKDCTIGTDGQCVFKNSQCKLMSDCTEANTKQLCSTKTCYWNETSSKCQPHQCETYANQNSCGLFYNFQKNQITYCAFDDKERVCKEISPISFTPVDCFQKSLGYFSNLNGTCQSCNNQNIPNTNPNQTDNYTTTPTNSDSLLFGSVFIIGLLIII
ncbi:unnamed protein product [Paramecium pentaurelia]|uniref:PSI domain-containing protein n=1 Tax=Paramecium pentaurelia TaxID=43138 RepID=A0A8S1U936_9CILI|nr:unnamed protein product [Paramecium pentaurelia]